jgi:hypothetical protein
MNEPIKAIEQSCEARNLVVARSVLGESKHLGEEFSAVELQAGLGLGEQLLHGMQLCADAGSLIAHSPTKSPPLSQDKRGVWGACRGFVFWRRYKSAW